MSAALLQPDISELLFSPEPSGNYEGTLSRVLFQNTYTNPQSYFQSYQSNMRVPSVLNLSPVYVGFSEKKEFEINQYRDDNGFLSIQRATDRKTFSLAYDANRYSCSLAKSFTDGSDLNDWGIGLGAYQLHNLLDINFQAGYESNPVKSSYYLIDYPLGSDRCTQYNFIRTVAVTVRNVDNIFTYGNRTCMPVAHEGGTAKSDLSAYQQVHDCTLRAGMIALGFRSGEYEQQSGIRNQNQSTILSQKMKSNSHQFYAGFHVNKQLQFVYSYTTAGLAGYALFNEYAYTDSQLSVFKGVSTLLIKDTNLQTQGLCVSYREGLTSYSITGYYAKGEGEWQSETGAGLLPTEKQNQSYQRFSLGVILEIVSDWKIFEKTTLSTSLTQIVPLYGGTGEGGLSSMQLLAAPVSGDQSASAKSGWGGMQAAVELKTSL